MCVGVCVCVSVCPCVCVFIVNINVNLLNFCLSIVIIINNHYLVARMSNSSKSQECVNND